MTPENLKEELRTLLAQLAKAPVADDTPLAELGLEPGRVASAIERHYHLTFDDEERADLSTLARAFAVMLAKLESRETLVVPL